MFAIVHSATSIRQEWNAPSMTVALSVVATAPTREIAVVVAGAETVAATTVATRAQVPRTTLVAIPTTRPAEAVCHRIRLIRIIQTPAAHQETFPATHSVAIHAL